MKYYAVRFAIGWIIVHQKNKPSRQQFPDARFSTGGFDTYAESSAYIYRMLGTVIQ
jgi:hypothetical protein